jgi:hypothetical protein
MKFNDFPIWLDHDERRPTGGMMEIPEWALAAGFEDWSCHNDEMARMRHKDAWDLVLWIGDERCTPRYILTLEDWDYPEDREETWRSANDHQEVLDFLADPRRQDFRSQLKLAIERDPRVRK